MDELEICQVREIGIVRKTKTIENFLGDKVDLTEGESIFLINTKFSDPNYGFVINKNGDILTKTSTFMMAEEEIRRYQEQAKQQLLDGKINEINMRINL